MWVRAKKNTVVSGSVGTGDNAISSEGIKMACIL